jgi:hypothetical protein
LIFCAPTACGGAPVGHRSGGDEHVVLRRQRQHRIVHLLRALHVDAAHAARRGQVHRAGHQGDVGAGLGAARAMAKPILPLEGW